MSALPRFPKCDNRLLGTWKSDKRRTFAEWNWRKNTSPIKKAALKSLFGKLEVTYTRTRVTWTLRRRNWTQARRYRVVAVDDDSIAVVEFGKMEIKNRRTFNQENLRMVEALFPAKPKIQHFHFDKKHYWISLGNGKNREFFRKVRSS